MPQLGSSATGGSMTTSHRSSAMFSTGCQSHSASSTSSVYSSFYHFMEQLQSTCAIAALGLIPPRLGYIYDHLRRPISGCGRTSATDRAFSAAGQWRKSWGDREGLSPPKF